MPTLINNYKTESLLSEGVLAASYLAIDILSDKRFVLKILKPETTSSLTEDLIRYKKVVAQVASFKHPFIASVFEQGEHEGSKYLLTELVEGKSLKELFKENKKFTPKEAAEVAYQLTSALEYAHNQNLLHLDLRPSNIIVQLSSLKTKLLDFGLSHLAEAPFKASTVGDLLHQHMAKLPSSLKKLRNIGINGTVSIF